MELQPWPEYCVFGHPGPNLAEADGTWRDKVEECTCTRCELTQLSLDQSKENGRLTGVMSRVKDLEKENACLKKENAQIQLRLALLERASKELLELAANFKQAYRAKKHYKRKIQKDDADGGEHGEPKKRDTDLDFEQDKYQQCQVYQQCPPAPSMLKDLEDQGVPALPVGHPGQPANQKASAS